MAVRSKTTIFNAALLRTGNDPATEGEGSALWMALEANYDEIVRACFEEGDGVFPFGRARRDLTSRVDGTFGFDDAYAIPFDAIHGIEVLLDGKSCADLLEPWEIDGINNLLLVSAGGRRVEFEFVAGGQEHTWSAQFALGIQRHLEAVIKDCLEETGESEAKTQAADFHMMKASIQGSKSRSARNVWKRGGGRLIRARRGGF